MTDNDRREMIDLLNERLWWMMRYYAEFESQELRCAMERLQEAIMWLERAPTKSDGSDE